MFFDRAHENIFGDPNALFVCYNAVAEWKTFLALGWEVPSNTVDLYVEYLNTVNGVWRGNTSVRELGTGLVDAMREHGLDPMDAAEKDAERQYIIANGTKAPEGVPQADHAKRIIDYCWTDVRGTFQLAKRMLPGLDFEQRCDQKVFEKFVGFVPGGLAIVARNRDIQIAGKYIPAQGIDLVQHTLRNVSGVRTFALGKRDGYRGIFRASCLSCATASVSKEHVGICFGGAVIKLLRYVTQVDGTSGVNPDHNLTQVFETREKSACLDLKLVIATRKTTGLATPVRVLELLHDRARRNAVGREPLCVDHYSYLPGLPADDLGLRNVIERLQ